MCSADILWRLERGISVFSVFSVSLFSRVLHFKMMAQGSGILGSKPTDLDGELGAGTAAAGFLLASQ